MSETGPGRRQEVEALLGAAPERLRGGQAGGGGHRVPGTRHRAPVKQAPGTAHSTAGQQSSAPGGTSGSGGSGGRGSPAGFS